MAFISEIKYDGSGEAAHNEFLEITLMPGEEPADFTVSIFNVDGTLFAGSSFFATGEFTLQDVVDLVGPDGVEASSVGGLDLQVLPHPDNPDALIFIIPATLSGGSNVGAAEAVALSDNTTVPATVISAYDIAGTNNVANANDVNSIVPIGTDFIPMGNAENANNNNRSRSWDYEGNTSTSQPNAGTSVICLMHGTLVETAEGPCRVEDLEQGALLRTARGDLRPLRANLRTDITLDQLKEYRLWPVKITAGALGEGLPKRDLYVSRQHRMLICSKIAERLCGSREVLIAAHMLVGLPGITLEHPGTDISYFHLLMDRHHVILANGAPSETLLLRSHSLSLVPADRLRKLQQRHPLVDPARGHLSPARPIPERKLQRELVEKLCNKGRNCIEIWQTEAA